MIWLYLSGLAMVVTAVIHSVAGEKRIVRPLLASDAAKLLGPQLSGVMRGAWHLTSIFMVLCAVVVVIPGMPNGALNIIGGVWLAIGLAILFRSRGRHPGWPTLSAGGAFAIIGALT